MVLGFHGSVHYLDSCTGNWGYASPSHSVTVDITESPQAQPVSLVMNKQNENPAKNPLLTAPLNLSWQPSSTINQKLDELQRELDQKLDNLKGELDLKTDKENRKRKRKLDQSMESTSSSTSSRTLTNLVGEVVVVVKSPDLKGQALGNSSKHGNSTRE